MENSENNLILVLNSGSSSLKFGVYSQGAKGEEPLLTGSAEGIGRADGTLNILSSNGKPLTRRENISETQSAALAALAEEIQRNIHSTLIAVGHRVVHGGPNLLTHQIITPKLLDELRAATHFAPLHIPQALSLISAAQTIFPNAAQFACFDDAFHQTMPETASHLPIPRKYFEAGIRRYGFHGLSYESLVHHFGANLPPRVIFAHLGNGASLCAVLNGKSIDTTMGLTPTGGIPMGTRSGDLDPGVLTYILRNEKLNADEFENLLNHESGLFALSGGESDVKSLEDRAREKDPRAIFALDAFAIAIRKAIGAYIALLGGVDLVVFTGGIGKHSEYVRNNAVHGLESLGLTTNKIQIVSAQEEQQIARHCRRLLQPAK